MGAKYDCMLRNFAQLITGDYAKIGPYDGLKLVGLESDIADAINKISDSHGYRIHQASPKLFDKSNEFRPQALLIGYFDCRFDSKMPHLQALNLKEDNNVFKNVENIVCDLIEQRYLTPADTVLLDQPHPELKALEEKLKMSNIKFDYDSNPDSIKLLYRVAEQLEQSAAKEGIPKERSGFYKALRYAQIVPVLDNLANNYLAQAITGEVKKGRFVVQLLPLNLLFMDISTVLSNLHKIPNITITPKMLR